MTKYPEHEKMASVRVQTDAIGAFLEALGEQGLVIAREHTHTETCYEDDEKATRNWPSCGYDQYELVDDRLSIERRLAAYLHIDLDKISTEKDEMLKEIRHGRE